MHRTLTAVLSAATVVVAAFGLSGCDGDDAAAPPSSVQTPAPITPPPIATAPPAAPDAAPLPPPSALTDVMYKLADTNIPGEQKVPLVQYATAGDAAALDRFGRALRDDGFTPLTFEANDLAWAQAHPGNVVANVVVKTANPQSGGDFTFPMEFSPSDGSWQLTRQTADMLLQLGQAPTATPPR